MGEIYNVYCDESRHLEHDGQPVMVIGALWCPREKTRDISGRLREIKIEHALSPNFEVKWTKASPAKVGFYRSVMDYFFDDDDLRFRALVAAKSGLRHDEFDQDHDTWYYKMFFELLKNVFVPEHRYRVYLDIKDTRSVERERTLHRVLCNHSYDFDQRIIERIQAVRSHESELLQVVDLLIGAIGYGNTAGGQSAAKQQLVDRLRKRSGYSLTRSTLLGERKLNIFHWRPRSPAGGR